jgi:hypothetical protein
MAKPISEIVDNLSLSIGKQFSVVAVRRDEPVIVVHGI